MAKNLFLYKYPGARDERYIEDLAEKIDDCFIDDEIFQCIENIGAWAKLVVYEEKGGETRNDFTCINNDKINAVKSLIVDKFFKDVHKINKDKNKLRKVDETITSTRTLCNIYFLLKLKLEKYAEDDRVVIQVV